MSIFQIYTLISWSYSLKRIEEQMLDPIRDRGAIKGNENPSLR
jgi:hypothetical protein